jgi:hypothetical protein
MNILLHFDPLQHTPTTPSTSSISTSGPTWGPSSLTDTPLPPRSSDPPHTHHPDASEALTPPEARTNTNTTPTLPTPPHSDRYTTSHIHPRHTTRKRKQPERALADTITIPDPPHGHREQIHLTACWAPDAARPGSGIVICAPHPTQGHTLLRPHSPHKPTQGWHAIRLSKHTNDTILTLPSKHTTFSTYQETLPHGDTIYEISALQWCLIIHSLHNAHHPPSDPMDCTSPLDTRIPPPPSDTHLEKEHCHSATDHRTQHQSPTIDHPYSWSRPTLTTILSRSTAHLNTTDGLSTGRFWGDEPGLTEAISTPAPRTYTPPWKYA